MSSSYFVSRYTEVLLQLDSLRETTHRRFIPFSLTPHPQMHLVLNSNHSWSLSIIAEGKRLGLTMTKVNHDGFCSFICRKQPPPSSSCPHGVRAASLLICDRKSILTISLNEPGGLLLCSFARLDSFMMNAKVSGCVGTNLSNCTGDTFGQLIANRNELRREVKPERVLVETSLPLFFPLNHPSQ